MKSRRFSILLFVLLSSCFSMTQVRWGVEITDGERSCSVPVWVQADLGTSESDVLAGALAVLVYPVDAVISCGMACAMVFNRDLSARHGVAGAVAAIALPGLTLFTGGMSFGPNPTRVTVEQFNELGAAIERGDEFAIRSFLARHVEALGASGVVLADG